MEIEKATELVSCTGVGGMGILKKATRELGPLQTLGPLASSQRAVERVANLGSQRQKAWTGLRGTSWRAVPTGVSAKVLEEVEDRGFQEVNTSWYFVLRGQAAARVRPGTVFL